MIFYDKIVNTLKSKNAFKSLESLLKQREVYVIGKNEESKNVIKFLNVIGIIDDFSNALSWEGVPIIKSNKIDKNKWVVNCATSIYPMSVRINLSQENISNIIDYYELAVDKRFPLPSFCLNTISDFENNFKQWSQLYETFEDIDSKKELENILLFRLTANPLYMKNYTVRLRDQYMEDFMEYSNEIMVDAGAFDGETSEIFCNKYPDYTRVHLFEPSEINFKKVKSRMENFRDMSYYNIGLSSSAGEVLFEDGLGLASKVSDKGNKKIIIDKLDNIIDDGMTFLKMDIEGWEIPCIEGSINNIKKYHPKLAVAVYHNPEDFWKILQLIFSIRDDYDVYLRHYTEGWSETVMYFKPKK
jgi:FkbM family methyltransferase